MKTIQDLLAAKAGAVETVAPTDTVAHVIERLNALRIGSLVVVDGEMLAGIITERDILRIVNERCQDFSTMSVSEVMSRDLIVGLPTDGIDYVITTMTENRVRHMPVTVDGKLMGLVSIGDVLKAHMTEKEFENRMLSDYIAGNYPA